MITKKDLNELDEVFKELNTFEYPNGKTFIAQIEGKYLCGYDIDDYSLVVKLNADMFDNIGEAERVFNLELDKVAGCRMGDIIKDSKKVKDYNMRSGYKETYIEALANDTNDLIYKVKTSKYFTKSEKEELLDKLDEFKTILEIMM